MPRKDMTGQTPCFDFYLADFFKNFGSGHFSKQMCTDLSGLVTTKEKNEEQE